MVETVNDRPAYKVSFWYNFETFGKEVPKLNLKRAENTEGGLGIYLYYISTESRKQWLITTESAFQDRRSNSYLYINSEGEQ